VGEGVCVNGGRVVCNDDGGARCDAQPLPADPPELCDALDNDCDGAADEDFALGDACTVGVGVCERAGVEVCADGGAGTTCSARPGDGGAEQCDALDNDCDGSTDEGFGLGDACTVGRGACERSGGLVCAADGSGATCDVQPGNPVGERCDGIDNDCDGATDEDFTVGAACSVGVGECRNGGQQICAPDGGGTVCGAQPLPEQPEICDGLDNNCNGEVDENSAGLGDDCSVGQGVCQAAGVVVCAGDGTPATVCDAEPGEGGVELCGTNADEDCDGRTDEGFAVGNACSVGVGACGNEGETVCTADRLGVECGAQPLPPGAADLCGTGIDEDCDGSTDEGYPTLGDACADGEGACAANGRIVCTPNRLGVACDAVAGEPGVELCGNQTDDDCDGAVDEGFVTVGDACSDGVGACSANGVIACTADRLGLICTAEADEPGIERCGTGVDEDCDGATDEGFDTLGDACSDGTGVCAANGNIVCSADRLGVECDAQAGQPGRELCGTGADEDCDGATDEAFETVGDACAAGLGECTASGNIVCTADRLGTLCNAEAGEPGEELCGSEADEDCDGNIDEGFDTVGDACSVGDGVCGASGNVICSEDGLGTECDAEAGAPGVELCGSEADEDCDGRTDEGFPTVGAACSAGTGACAANGNVVCSANGLGTECDAEAGQAGFELCGTQADEDCDGNTDEGFPTVGDPCTDGVGVCSAAGRVVCDGSRLGVLCDAQPGQPGVELCGNNLDDDCDGNVDEGFEALGDDCSEGLGACAANGRLACTANRLGLACTAEVGEPGIERCGTGADEDCDGATDEGFPTVGDACSVGTGVCSAIGNVVCAENGLGVECDAEAGAPGSELCGTNLDEDCDGNTDEGFATVGDACSEGIGECAAAGNVVCSADRLGVACDAVPDEPGAELCGTGLDEDCDARIDEGFAVEEACTVGDGACANEGVTVCTLDGLGVECGVEPLPPAPLDLCGNQTDDDCDGRTDEGFANLGNQCFDGIGACLSRGTFVCTQDRTATECDAVAGQPGVELCGNLVDDDCDEATDEGYQVGQACTVGVGACLNEGQTVCTADRLGVECGAEPLPPSPEICDAVDNNCNGQTDETSDDLGNGCTAGLGECAADGVRVCAGDGSPATVCDAVPGQPNPNELCDGFDDDCDGRTDEDYDLASACRVGVGQCARGGVLICDPNDPTGTTCSATPGQPQAEICDGIDNDCDGTVDNGICCDPAPIQVNQATGGRIYDERTHVTTRDTSGNGETVGVLYNTIDDAGSYFLSFRRADSDGAFVGDEETVTALSSFGGGGTEIIPVDAAPVQGGGSRQLFLAAFDNGDFQAPRASVVPRFAEPSALQIFGPTAFPLDDQQNPANSRSAALDRTGSNTFAAAWIDQGNDRLVLEEYQALYQVFGAGIGVGYVRTAGWFNVNFGGASPSDPNLDADGSRVVLGWQTNENQSGVSRIAYWETTEPDGPQASAVFGGDLECSGPDVAILTGLDRAGMVASCSDGSGTGVYFQEYSLPDLNPVGGLTLLSEPGFRAYEPAVAADDEAGAFRIVFSEDTNVGPEVRRSHLWEIRADGNGAGAVRRLTETNDASADFRRSGHLAFGDSGERFAVMQAGGDAFFQGSDEENTYLMLESCLCGGEVCDTGSPGACGRGVVECDGEGGTTCEPLNEPGFEECGGVDDDCDGVVDEGLCCDRESPVQINTTYPTDGNPGEMSLESAAFDGPRTIDTFGVVYLTNAFQSPEVVTARVYDSSGAPIAGEQVLGQPNDTIPLNGFGRGFGMAPASLGTRLAPFDVFVVAWVDETPEPGPAYQLYFSFINARTGARVLTANGTYAIAAPAVEGTQGDVQFPSLASFDGNGVVAAWHDPRFFPRAAAYRFSVDTSGRVPRVDVSLAVEPVELTGPEQNGFYPEVAAQGDQALVTFNGTLGQTFGTFSVLWDGILAGNRPVAPRVLNGVGGLPETCVLPDVAWTRADGGLYGIACHVAVGQLGELGDVYYAGIDTGGGLAGVARMNTVAGDANIATIAPTALGFAASWSDTPSGTGWSGIWSAQISTTAQVSAVQDLGTFFGARLKTFPAIAGIPSTNNQVYPHHGALNSDTAPYFYMVQRECVADQ
jgi:hypothetical protein